MSEKPAADALSLTVDAQGRIFISVRVVPRAPQTRLAGIRNGALVVRLAAPPVDGAANETLVEFLSSVLDCPRRNITLTSGNKSRDKRVRIEGMSHEVVGARLLTRNERQYRHT
jgi:uncharacterized protein (TIGR00251 family)